jgi:uncharacterized protein with PQ loop repeat
MSLAVFGHRQQASRTGFSPVPAGPAKKVQSSLRMVDAIGWVSSVILLVTIWKQIYKQWHDHTSKGVSLWLFIGQLAASVGFTIYSLLLRNWVFVVTNGVMVLNGLVGYGLTLRQKTSASADGSSPSS